MSTATQGIPAEVVKEEQLRMKNEELKMADGLQKEHEEETPEGYIPPRTAAEIRAIMKTDHEHLTDAEVIRLDNAIRIMCRSLLCSVRDKRLAATAV